MTEQATQSKMNAEFYKKYPEFQKRKDIVVSVLEMIEGKNVGMDYNKVLELAVPEIRNRIGVVDRLDMQSINPNPDRNFDDVIDIGGASNGDI